MNIINILKNLCKKPKLVLYYLDRIGLYRMDDEKYIKMQYEIKVGKRLNLNPPKTFNEKIQWLKLNDRNPEYTKMVDKYEVKKYVADIIGEKYIIPTLGVYEKFDDIDFDKLPNKFVIKCTHDSGGIVICKDKNNFNKKEAKKKINRCLKRNFYYVTREWPYKNVKPRIIIEKYMIDESNKQLKDYKIFCFNGKVKYIQVDFDRFDNHKRNIYDVNWNLTDIQMIYSLDKNKKIEKPQKLEDMIKLAEKLSKDRTFIRVDFYSIIDKIFFGELTFYPDAGLEKYNIEKFDGMLGDILILPKNEK